MRRRSAILAFALLALVNGLGCGGADHPRVDPERMLDSAAAHPIATARIGAEVRLRARGVAQLRGPITLRAEGPYRSGEAGLPGFDWRVSASALGFPVGGRLISTGENVYLSVYGNGYEVGEAAVAAADSRIAEAGGAHFDFRRWLGPAHVSGEGRAGGEDCERISAPLRGERFARDLTPLATALGIAMPALSGRATACVGFDDRVLHELEVAARLETGPGERIPSGATDVRLRADVELSAVGEPQSISAPGSVQRPIRDLLLTLNDLGVPIPLG